MSSLGGRTHLILHIKDPHDVRGLADVVNPYFAEKRMDMFDVPINVRRGDLEDVLPRLAKLGNVRGFLISMPFKETIIPLLTSIGPQARMVGAVNCVRIEAGGRLAGEMFDGVGLLAAARENGIDYVGRRMLLLGAGGAARAIAFSAVEAGVTSLDIYNRTTDRAVRLVADVRNVFPGARVQVSNGVDANVDLVVSCIPGLESVHLPAADPPWLRKATDVIDIVPSPGTQLVERARAKGAKAIDGRPMIFHQIELMVDFIGRPPALET